MKNGWWAFDKSLCFRSFPIAFVCVHLICVQICSGFTIKEDRVGESEWSEKKKTRAPIMYCMVKYDDIYKHENVNGVYLVCFSDVELRA